MGPSPITGQNQATVSPLHLKGTITDSKSDLAGMSGRDVGSKLLGRQQFALYLTVSFQPFQKYFISREETCNLNTAYNKTQSQQLHRNSKTTYRTQNFRPSLCNFSNLKKMTGPAKGHAIILKIKLIKKTHNKKPNTSIPNIKVPNSQQHRNQYNE